jgi:hypothetical protein
MEKKVCIMMALSGESPETLLWINKYKQIHFVEIGVGLFEVSHRFSQNVEFILKEQMPVILAGTAGSFISSDKKQISLSNSFSLLKDSREEIPGIVDASWATKSFLADCRHDLLDVPVYSTFGISVSSALKDSMSGHWENMEAGVLSYLCYRNQIPFEALLYCTNFIGPQSRVEWKKEQALSGVEIAQCLKSILSCYLDLR